MGQNRSQHRAGLTLIRIRIRFVDGQPHFAQRAKGPKGGPVRRSTGFLHFEFACVRNSSTWRECGAWLGFQFIARRCTWNPESDFYGFLKNKIYGLSYCATHALRIFRRARPGRRPVQAREEAGAFSQVDYVLQRKHKSWLKMLIRCKIRCDMQQETDHFGIKVRSRSIKFQRRWDVAKFGSELVPWRLRLKLKLKQKLKLGMRLRLRLRRT